MSPFFALHVKIQILELVDLCDFVLLFHCFIVPFSDSLRTHELSVDLVCRSSFRDLPTATDALVAGVFWKHEYVKVMINNAAWEVANMHNGVTRMPAEESIQEA